MYYFYCANSTEEKKPEIAFAQVDDDVRRRRKKNKEHSDIPNTSWCCCGHHLIFRKLFTSSIRNKGSGFYAHYTRQFSLLLWVLHSLWNEVKQLKRDKTKENITNKRIWSLLVFCWSSPSFLCNLSYFQFFVFASNQTHFGFLFPIFVSGIYRTFGWFE